MYVFSIDIIIISYKNSRLDIACDAVTIQYWQHGKINNSTGLYISYDVVTIK